MRVDRLIMLADYLEGKGQFANNSVPVRKFDLELWMGQYKDFLKPFKGLSNTEGVEPFIVRKVKRGGETHKILTPVECQTAGCAIGWAATIPEFNEQGLFLANRTRNDMFVPTVFPIFYDKIDKCWYKEFRALEEFFNIDTNTISILFMPDSYPLRDRRNPKKVAKRIRELILADNSNDYNAIATFKDKYYR